MENLFYPPPSPKQFMIREIPAKMASELNSKWHSILPNIHWSNIVRNKHYVCYGAEYTGKWFAVGIWTSPVAANRFKHGSQMLELRRLAISNEAPYNTASWMLSQMVKRIKIKFPEIRCLVSYQATKFHDGTIYKAANWIKDAEVKFSTWNTKNRKRNNAQIVSNKIRWKYKI